MKFLHQTNCDDCSTHNETMENIRIGLKEYNNSALTFRDDVSWELKLNWVAELCDKFVFTECKCRSTDKGFRHYMIALFFVNFGRVARHFNHLDLNRQLHVFNAMLFCNVFKSPFCVGKHLPGKYSFYKEPIMKCVQQDLDGDLEFNAFVLNLDSYINERDKVVIKEERENKIKNEKKKIAEEVVKQRKAIQISMLKSNDRDIETRGQAIECILAEYAELVKTQKKCRYI